VRGFEISYATGADCSYRGGPEFCDLLAKETLAKGAWILIDSDVQPPTGIVITIHTAVFELHPASERGVVNRVPRPLSARRVFR
jgi:hypothetical protein